VEAFVDLEDSLADADVVVEVVPEKMAIKKDVYDEVVEYAPRRPSSSPTPPASRSLNSPRSLTGRALLRHALFNPPVRMDLVEVISGKHTSEDTLERSRGLRSRWENSGPRPEGQPRFIVNRILVP